MAITEGLHARVRWLWAYVMGSVLRRRAMRAGPTWSRERWWIMTPSGGTLVWCYVLRQPRRKTQTIPLTPRRPWPPRPGVN